MADLKPFLSSLSASKKRALAVAIIAGGVLGARQLRVLLREAQKAQRSIASEIVTRTASGVKTQQAKIAVDRLFFIRLSRILKICIPSLFSKEALLVAIQTALLILRSLLSEWISLIEGKCGRYIVTTETEELKRSIIEFALIGIPASIVNAGLKYMQKMIELAFQGRMARHLHEKYTSNRAYYAASTLGGLTNADQRITEDVEKFCFTISDLYSHTFKPLVDMLLFTRTLANMMGWRSQIVLYSYFLGSAWLLKSIAPPMASMTATEAALGGAFRAAHQRLVASSEEIAFNDPPAGKSECLILNKHLSRLIQYSRLSSLQRFLQQIGDNYFVKYGASVVSISMYALPIILTPADKRKSQASLTEDYIRSMRLLQNTCRAIADLILVYKRVAMLASHTGRVSELLEQIHTLSAEDVEHRELFHRNVSAAHQVGGPEDQGADPQLAPERKHGSYVSFHRVALDAPDGTPLVRELSFDVLPATSVLLMGPNGCGKSSLLRVLAGLWPLAAGYITTPEQGSLFYISQRPYLVSGSLRDQLLYPLPPRSVWLTSSPSERAKLAENVSSRRSSVWWLDAVSPSDASAAATVDERLRDCLKSVELEYLLTRGNGWDQVQSWAETLSGGEKQRLAMARLLFHAPDFAILDECTSAVSADGEVRLYSELVKAGITLLSVAHRPMLKRFHSVVIHFDGNVAKTGRGWWVEKVESSSFVQPALGEIASAGPSPSTPDGPQ